MGKLIKTKVLRGLQTQPPFTVCSCEFQFVHLLFNKKFEIQTSIKKINYCFDLIIKKKKILWRML